LLKVLAYQMSGINFSSEYAKKASLETNGIENVEALVGRPQPDQYSAPLSALNQKAWMNSIQLNWFKVQDWTSPTKRNT